MSRSCRIFLVGYYGVGNLGDEAIKASIERWAAGKQTRIGWYATRDPADPDPRAVRLGDRRTLRYLAACWRADRVVLGGGGILKDEGLRLPAELLITALLARVARRELTLLAVGVGPFYTSIGRWMVGAVARLAEVRTVRDAASQSALIELGVSRVRLGADPIFSTAPPRLSTSETVRGPSKCVVVSVRPWFHKDLVDGQTRWLRLVASVASALDGLAADGWLIRFIGMHWPRDREAALDVVRHMRHAGRATVDERPLSWQELLATQATAGLCVAMRYHALASAAIAGTPAVGLVYEPKVRELVRELELPAHEVDAGDVEAAIPQLVRAVGAAPYSAVSRPHRVEELRRRSLQALRQAMFDRRRTQDHRR